jgi:hypothetical protein
MIKAIYRNSVRLERLTSDILDVTRIESEALRIDKERFNLKDVILGAMQDTRSQLANGKVRFVCNQEDVHLQADRGRITQVVSNLLDNAAKFTKEGTISISAEKRNGRVMVSVKDTGTGIDSDIMPRLFSKFATKSDKGTGLGLFISKSIVEAHGGTIWAGNNSDGKGATFSFSLPLRFLRSEAPTPDQLPQITDNQRTIDQLKRAALEKIEIMKASLLDAREEAVRKRNGALERYQKQVDDSRNLIRARQEFINQQISYKRMRRDVDELLLQPVRFAQFVVQLPLLLYEFIIHVIDLIELVIHH